MKHKVEICTCVCHRDGIKINHFFPCCGLSEQKYIDGTGMVNQYRYNRMKISLRNEDLKQKLGPF